MPPPGLALPPGRVGRTFPPIPGLPVPIPPIGFLRSLPPGFPGLPGPTGFCLFLPPGPPPIGFFRRGGFIGVGFLPRCGLAGATMCLLLYVIGTVLVY